MGISSVGVCAFCVGAGVILTHVPRCHSLSWSGVPPADDETHKFLASALARPEQLAHCGLPDAADLAASYGFGISCNHPFIDANQRTAFVAVELFLTLNGFDLTAPDADCVLNMLDLAAENLPEAAFAEWIRQNLQSQSW